MTDQSTLFHFQFQDIWCIILFRTENGSTSSVQIRFLEIENSSWNISTIAWALCIAENWKLVSINNWHSKKTSQNYYMLQSWSAVSPLRLVPIASVWLVGLLPATCTSGEAICCSAASVYRSIMMDGSEFQIIHEATKPYPRSLDIPLCLIFKRVCLTPS
jgi:hypothetical protein